MLILTLLITTLFTSLAFAEENKPIIDSMDTTYQLDDLGIYDMILKVDDPVKKQKILDYWAMPAWHDNTEQTEKEGNEILLANYDTIKKLIATPANLIDKEIDKLLALNVDMISQDSNKKVFPSFMNVLEKRSISNRSKLTNKVSESVGMQFENSSVKTESISPTSVNQKSVTANYTEGNPSGMAYLMINCKITWDYNTVTKDITYLAPHTTTGYSSPRVVFPNTWESLSGEWIVDGTVDRGVVHKATKYFLSHDLANPMGYVVVNGNGTVVKNYADALSAYSNAYSGYSWSSKK